MCSCTVTVCSLRWASNASHAATLFLRRDRMRGYDHTRFATGTITPPPFLFRAPPPTTLYRCSPPYHPGEALSSARSSRWWPGAVPRLGWLGLLAHLCRPGRRFLHRGRRRLCLGRLLRRVWLMLVQASTWGLLASKVGQRVCQYRSPQFQRRGRQ
jgi:hypothetical protein